MIRLFIIDDHPLVVEGIRAMLAAVEDMEVIGSAETASAARGWLKKHQADVIILDISLPDSDGMKLCREIVGEKPDARIIALTTYEEVSFVRGMLQEGALGYLFKTSSTEEFVAAVRSVMNDEQYLAEAVNKKLIASALKRDQAPAFIPKLTRREKEVLALIMDENTNQEIAQALNIAVSTVETHRTHLCEKLGARNTAGLVRNAMRLGLG